VTYLLGRGDKKELEQDFGVFGVPPQEFLDGIKDKDFELWEENAEPFDLFVKLQTQWRSGPSGFTGMDYAGVRAALAMMRRRMTPELFGLLQVMETAGLKALRESKNDN
jgi:hypothetical protein